MTERIERRVLGAVRFVDATTRQKIQGLLTVRADQAKFVRNLSNYYVISSATGLEEHEAAFQDPPGAPAVGSVSIVVQVLDPTGGFLGRQFTLALPRDPQMLDPADPASLFHPVDVDLYPSPVGDVAPGWALVRASVQDKDTGTLLPGALVRVLLKSDSSLLASGLADSRGEALVAVPGIPVTTFGAGPDDPVTTSEKAVTLEAIFDPDAGAWPDPDAIVKNKAGLPESITDDNFKLASGGFLGIVLKVPVPADVIALLKEKKKDA